MSLPTTLRRWFRFSLAELLVATILLGAGVGIYVLASTASFQHDLKLESVRVARLISRDELLVLYTDANRQDQLLKVHLRSGSTTPFVVGITSKFQADNRVYALEVSRDHRIIAISLIATAPLLVVCDATTGKITRVFDDAIPAIVAVSIHGGYIATKDETLPDGTKLGPVYDVTEGKLIPEWRKCAGVRLFLANDSRVLCITPSAAKVIEFPSAKPLFSIGRGACPACVVALADDESCVAIQDEDGTVGLFNPESGSFLGPRIDHGHGEVLADVAIEPSGNLVAASSFSRKITLWNRYTGKQEALIDTGAINQYVAFPERGRLLTLSADGKLTVRRVGANNSEIALYIVAACALAVLILLRLFRRLPAKKARAAVSDS
ncbi:MAG TPA: WD40 repeat domain-containing protein [Planctomycetota bacterium]|nr:WD40 repeat domain-containing protein [Planctomycetota bacterium]